MADTKFTPGQDCWLHNGQKAKYVGALEGRHAVRVYLAAEFAHDWNDDGGVEIWPSSDIHLVGEVLTSPPVNVVAKEISEAEERLSALNKEFEAKSDDLDKIISQALDARKKAAQYPNLDHVFDLIDGKFTHCLVAQYGQAKIWEFDEFMREASNQYDARDGLKLLSLFGKSSRSFEYRVNEYKDGSGNWLAIDLFKSEKEAKSHLSKSLSAEWKTALDSKNTSFYTVKKLAESCKMHGLEIPKEVSAKLDEIDAKAKAERITKAEAALAKARGEANG